MFLLQRMWLHVDLIFLVLHMFITLTFHKIQKVTFTVLDVLDVRVNMV